MPNYVFTLNSGPITLHSDIDYVTDDSGNKVYFEDGYVIADWSVVPLELLIGHSEFTILSGVIHVSGQVINFKIIAPLLPGQVIVSGQSIEIYKSLYFPLLSGTIRINGQTIAITTSHDPNLQFILDSGTIRVIGTPLNMSINRVFPISHPTKFKLKKGDIVIVGSPITFKHTFTLSSGAIHISGQDLEFIKFYNIVISLDSGTIYVVGKPIQILTEPKTMPLVSGDIRISGSDLLMTINSFELLEGHIHIGRPSITFIFTSIDSESGVEIIRLWSEIINPLTLHSTINSPVTIPSTIIREMKFYGNIHW